tara:strand:- start:18460 stop:19092 length:633 start_codon:yes stop_codon:yes gene_type:complete
MNAVPSTAPRGRLQLILLAMLFFLPLLISYVLYFWFPDYRPSGTTNYGQLLDPAKPLPISELGLRDAKGEALAPEALLGRWNYLILGGNECSDTCRRNLVMARQVRLSLNEKRSRVQCVLIVDSVDVATRLAAELKDEHPQLLVIADETQGETSLHSTLQPPEASMYLSDPHGNWLMSYPTLTDTQEGTLADFKGIKKDIKKLLRLSQIG